ncbi:hypothetical protein F4819DRAFT_485869 [Hypoxylon fuscum]|nr:hypothetical protein F4819DRAFT_485869 [Hypoxylon fuscum]
MAKEFGAEGFNVIVASLFLDDGDAVAGDEVCLDVSGKENEDDDEIVKDSEDAKEEDENECMVEAVDFEGDVLETDDAVAVVAFAVVAFGGWPPFGLLAAGPHSTKSAHL